MKTKGRTMEVQGKFNQLKTTFLTLTVLILLAFPVTTWAVPTLQGPTTAATGINDLVIGAVTYDVTFSNFGSFNALGENPPTFLGDQAGAHVAEIAIASFLQGLASGITDLLPISEESNFILIPYSLDTTHLMAEAPKLIKGSVAVWVVPTGQLTINRTNAFTNLSWASFTPTVPVPEPSIIALLGIVLVGLVGAGTVRMIKQKKVANI